MRLIFRKFDGIDPKYQEYYSEIERYEYQRNEALLPHDRNINRILSHIIVMLLNYGGGFIIISALFTFFIYKDNIFNIAYAIYSLNSLPFLYYCISINTVRSIYSIPWRVFAFAHFLYLILLLIEKGDRTAKRVRIYAFFVLFFCLYFMTNIKTLRYIKESLIDTFPQTSSNAHLLKITDCSYSDIVNYINDSNSLMQMNKIRDFLESRRYRQIKGYFKPNEYVYEIGFYRFPYMSLPELYGFIPLDYHNILNKALYGNDPKEMTAILKRLGIRYILFSGRHYEMPKPTLFKREFSERWLKLIDEGPLYYIGSDLHDYKDISLTNDPKNKEALYYNKEMLFEVLYEQSPQPDHHVADLLDEHEFRGSAQQLSILTSSSLTDDIIDRMKNFYK